MAVKLYKNAWNNLPSNLWWIAEVSDDSTHEWLSKILLRHISQYKSRDFFSADECGLFFKLLADKLYVFKGETCHGGKFSKKWVTVLFAANADGSQKLPPLVIGKSAKPRCFTNVKMFPCDYENQRRAWMTGDIFAKWLRNLDRKNRRILIFINNCPVHPKNVKLESIEFVFLSANSRSKL